MSTLSFDHLARPILEPEGVFLVDFLKEAVEESGRTAHQIETTAGIDHSAFCSLIKDYKTSGRGGLPTMLIALQEMGYSLEIIKEDKS